MGKGRSPHQLEREPESARAAPALIVKTGLAGARRPQTRSLAVAADPESHSTSPGRTAGAPTPRTAIVAPGLRALGRHAAGVRPHQRNRAGRRPAVGRRPSLPGAWPQPLLAPAATLPRRSAAPRACTGALFYSG